MAGTELEQKRLEALKLYDILDTLPEQEFDDITRMASEICQMPVALISLIDEHRQWFKSKIGLDVPETDRDLGFCTHAIEQGEVFEITDAQNDERFSDNPHVTGFPHVRYYAGAPLINKDGYKLGTLCVIDSTPRHLTDGQKRSLEILARSVMSLLEARHQQKEADFFRKALDELAAVSVVNNKYDFEYVNDKFCEIVGMEPGELLGTNSAQVALADVSDADRQEILGRINSREVYRGRIKNVNKNGDVSWSNATVIPYTDRNNNIIKIFSLRIDITPRVKMLERFEEAEKLSGIGSWEINVLNGARYWSKNLYAIMGFDADNLPAEVPSVLSYVLPENRAKLEAELGAVIKGDRGGGFSEVSVTDSNGSKRCMSITSKTTLNSKGEVILLSGTAQDITERKENEDELQQMLSRLELSEAKYRSLVEETSLMSYTTDVEGRYTYVSARLRKMLGYEDEEILGKQFAFISDADWRKRTILFYVQQLQNNVQETTYIFPINNKNGDTIWLEQVATLIREHNQIKGFMCVLHDITEQVTTEEAMREAVRLATEAREMQQNFLSRMSHEIRTPMNGVLGMVNLLKNTPLSDKQLIYTDGISRSAVNMLRIINDILDISKIEAGKIVFEETDFDLAELVDNVLLTIKPAADEKKLIVASHIDRKIPTIICADPVRLNQVLLNIAGNALKFTEKGSVIISADQVVSEDDSVTIEFKVTDTGIGIAQDKLGSIFESFTQAENSTTRKYGGTGLGLTIARQLIEQQNGKIAVESEQGRGTTFTFTYHCKKSVQNNVADTLMPVSSLPPLQNVRILLVEDNVINQMVAQYTMEQWGVKVTIADSGKAAIDLLRERQYDLILMDIQMPAMSGLEATKIIREELGVTTPIIAMTASAMKGERNNCIMAGMNDYFSKPFEPVDFNNIIHKHLSGSKHGVARQLINIPHLLKMVANDVQSAKSILAVFIETMPTTLTRMERSRNEKELNQLHNEVHNLKNSIGILGKQELNELLIEVENDIDKRLFTETTDSNIKELEQKLAILAEEAKAEYQLL